MYNSPYLKDIDFLHKFDKNRNKEQFLKVTILDWKNESPIQEVTGSVLDGNISLDGSSAMRRTANISLLLDDYNYKIEDVKNIISINKKVQIMIGFENNTDKYANYPVLWFPQGIYIIISASISHDSNGIKVSLTLHDKMALLNGECGGIIPAATVFNEIQNEDDYGNITKEYPTIVQIIQQLVNHFGNEQLGKIIIKDLQPIVKQVLKWNGDSDTPLYIYQSGSSKESIFVESLKYEIYKQIFIKTYLENGYNKKQAQSACNNFFENNGIIHQIPELKELIHNLESLRKEILKKDKEIEKQKDNLNTLKNLLEQQNFSLASDIQKKINTMRLCFQQIKKQIQITLKKEIKNQSILFNEFRGGASFSTDNRLQILNIGTPKKLYYQANELRNSYQKIKAYLDKYVVSNAFKNQPKKFSESPTYVSLLTAILAMPRQDNNFYKQNNNQNNQIKTKTKYYNSKEETYYGFEIPDNNYKENEIKNIFIYEKEDKEDGNEYMYADINALTINLLPSLSISGASKTFFQKTEAYYCFQQWLSIRKYFKNTPKFQTTRLKTLEILIFSTITYIFNNWKKLSINSDAFFNLINYFSTWCDVVCENLQELIDSQQELLIAAKDVKNNLLNSSVLDTSFLTKPHSLLKNFQGSFFDFLNNQSKELKDLILKLPLKKSIKNETTQQNEIVQYRNQSLKAYSYIETYINNLKTAIKGIKFQNLYTKDNIVYPTGNLEFIYEPLVVKFNQVLNQLGENEKDKKEKWWLKIFYNANDTSNQKTKRNKIVLSLSKINSLLSTIQNYKNNFTKKSLIQIQHWMNTTDFKENTFLFPKELTDFYNEENFNLTINNLDNNNTINANLIDLQSQIQNNNFKSVFLNKKLLDKIIQKIPKYINSNVQNINTEMPLSDQIAEYIKKIKELIKNQDDKIEQEIKNISKEELSKIALIFLNEINKIQFFQTGDDIGYSLVDFTYPGSLTANAGETITSVLDKIKNTLGNYQYFYDINGNFVFQEIRNFINKSYSTYLLQENSSPSYNYNNTNGKYIYNFNDGEIIQSYSNSINYQDIKNDFIVWGERKTADGKKYPIRYHLAIDNKPAISSVYYIPIDKNSMETYLSIQDFPIKGDTNKYYYSLKENQFYKWISEYENSSFFGYKKLNKKIKKCEPLPKNANDYKSNTCYYYYTKDNVLQIKYVNTNNEKPNYLYFSSKDYRTELYLDGVINEELGLTSNDYYVELKAEWPKLFNFSQGAYYSSVKKNPDNIDYYLDLLSTSNLTSQYGIPLIGKRTKIITNNNINCIFEPTCPDYVFSFSDNAIDDMINLNQSKADQKKQRAELQKKQANIEEYYKQWNKKNNLSQFSHLVEVDYNIYKNFANGGTARSAYQEIRSVLYQYLTYNQQVSLTTVPIYYLEPNNLIQINDNLSNIFGSYLIKSISLPLGGKGTMTINCTKAIEKI